MRFSLKPFFSIMTISCLVTYLPSSYAIESSLWKQFKRAKQQGTEPALPDFSYAGYNYSESDIPSTDDWPVFDVTKYGAIPNDAKHDDLGIQKAIHAAEKNGGGIVYFPSGKFIVSDNNDIDKNIFVTKGNIVLKGSGSGPGGSEIYQDQMKVNNGKFMFTLGHKPTRDVVLTTTVGEARREQFEVNVADASKLQVGQKVLLFKRSVEYSTRYYSPQKLGATWKRLVGKDPKKPSNEQGFNFHQIHSIHAVSGNTVTFREPLRLPIYKEIPIAVKAISMISNVGVEDILFTGGWGNHPKTFKHHDSKIDDYGWNALRFYRVHNGWIRNVEFKDWNQVMMIEKSSAITVDNILISGKAGHSSIHLRSSYGVLVKDSEDKAGQHHGPSVGYWNSSAVYLRYTMQDGQRIDSHSGSPVATLMDNVVNGTFDGNGGPSVGFPHHAKYFVAWNFRLKDEQEFSFWPEDPNNLDKRAGLGDHIFAMPWFIGVHGSPFKVRPSTYSVNEHPGQIVKPKSLFEAQLKLRLSK